MYKIGPKENFPTNGKQTIEARTFLIHATIIGPPTV